MEKITIYHGSNVVVNRPKVLTHGFYKDFGYGFYCTNFLGTCKVQVSDTSDCFLHRKGTFNIEF